MMNGSFLLSVFIVVGLSGIFQVNECQAQDFEDVNISPTVFESTTLPTDENGTVLQRYMASVGNGHVATTVYTDTVYMNGFYNGERGESHRARIPSMNNIRLDRTGLEILEEGFGLDVGNGTFFERFSTADFTVVQRTFAHRFYHKVIVTQIDIKTNSPGALFNLKPVLNSGDVSTDLNLDPQENFVSASEISAVSQCGQTKLIEDPKYQANASSICLISTTLPSSISGNKSQVFTFFTSYDVSFDGAANDFEKVAALVANGDDEAVLSSHTEAWAQVWQDGRIEIGGNVKLAKLMYGCLYYLLSSLPIVQGTNSPVGQFYGLSPGGLAYGDYLMDYQGHSFWDTETWMYPSILYFYPEIAREVLNYRLHALPAARDRANDTGFEGARFPWESGFTGREVTPDCCPETRDFQIHNTGDVAFAIRQYVASTRDMTWLSNKNREAYVTNGCGIIREIAEFWASRSTYDANTNQFDIDHVMCPDEDAYDVDNSIYTNVVAGYSIFFAEYAKCLCGEAMDPVPAEWVSRAKAFTYLYDAERDFHPEYEGYETNRAIKQADVVLLGFPLQYPMNESTRKNDLLIYENVTRENGPAMTWAMHTVGFLELEDEEKSSALFNKSYQPYMREPFKVWTEAIAPAFGAVNFVTGMGGFLQSVVSGYGGLRLYPERLEFDRPRLLPETREFALRGLKYLGSKFDVEIRESLAGVAVFRMISASSSLPLTLTYTKDGNDVTLPFESGSVLEAPSSGKIIIQTTQATNCPLPIDKIGGTYEMPR